MNIEYGNLEDFKILHEKLSGHCYWEGKIWRIKKKEKVVALVNFHCYNGYDIEVDLCAFTPEWLTRKILRTFFSYCFEVLKCRRISASTSKSNKRARKFIEDLGFLYEGNRKRARKDGQDQIDYGMLRKDCKWI